MERCTLADRPESDLILPLEEATMLESETVIAQSQSVDMASKTDCKMDKESVSMAMTPEKLQNMELQENMIGRLAKSDAHFKHQQRGEPDLTHEEKSKIAREILLQNQVTFLSRFGKFLQEDDVKYFQQSDQSYEINFYLTQISERLNSSKNKINVKNRRYEAMKNLVEAGEYFSDEQMKWRDPYLYEQMIGQYLTHEERQAEIDKSDLRFSTILLKHLSQQQENCLYNIQKDNEECQVEEEESDEDCEEEEMFIEEDTSDKEDFEPLISSAEKSLLREEFIHIMQERFISGKDLDFDYSTVDENLEYDSLKIRAQDEEEKYFDDDSDRIEETIFED